MESIFGIVGKDFVLVAADAKAARSILVYKDDEDKMMQLDSHKLLLGAGPQSDRVEFSEYIQKNLKLYELRNGVRLDGSAAANYVRGELARYLRQGPYQVNLLVAAVDQVSEAEAQLTPEKMAGTPVPSLHWIDYLGSMVKMNYGVHGYGAHFCLSILDKEWQPELSLEEAKRILKLCRNELDTRFLVRSGKWIFKVIDGKGIREIEV